MADELAPQQPAPEAPAAPAPDPVAEYQARLAAAEARAQQAEQARLETERQAQERLAQVAYAVSQMNEANQGTQPVEDDGEVVTLGKMKGMLREFGSEFAKAAQNTVTEEAAASYKHMRALNRREAQSDPGMRHYGKYKDEIEAAIDKLPPKLQANPDTYRGVYNFVLSKHMDDVLETEVSERLQRKLAESEDDYYEPEPQAQPQRRAEPPMPRGDGSRQAIAAPGRRGPQKLDDWDRFAAARFYGGDTQKLVKAKERANAPASLDDLLGLNK